MSEIKVDTVAEKTSANGVTVDGLNIKDSKLVTANSVITSNVTDANITLAKLAGDSVDGTKIADNAINSEHYTDASIDAAHLNADVITGHTAETSIADADTLLIHDASASALRKMTKANFVSGIGGQNTPYWYAYGHASGQGSSSGTFTKMEATKIFDSSSAYDDSNFRWTCPSGQGGKYWVSIATQPYNTSVQGTGSQVVPYHNGNSKGNAYNASHHAISLFRNHWISWSGIIDVSAGDYLEAYYFTVFNSGSGGAAYGKFSGYKLIE